HFKMATRCIAPSKWRLPCPMFRSVNMAHACNDPQPSIKPVPSTHKLRPPHSPTVSSNSPPSPLGKR
ncbi:hypothetical protein NQZ68_028401, partial [Dissostichus eleginoides]